jgi:predicted MPP superfamily phosphohydrolase
MRRRAHAATAATIVATAGAALAWRALWHEPRHGRLRRRTLRLPRWPGELAGLRVAVISDLHAGAPHVGEARIARLVAAVNRRRPDLVVLLGDFVDPEVKLGSPVTVEAVAGRLAALRAPHGVIAVLGNHDWRYGGPRVAAALRAGGIEVLENAATRAGPLWVAGLADVRTRVLDVEIALHAALAEVPAGAPVLLLSHDPDVFPSVPERVALTLSGHTHAGQVAIRRLRRGAIPSGYGERYASGHVVEDGRHLFVTAGVGTTGWPVRLLAPAEVVLLELRGDQRGSAR